MTPQVAYGNYGEHVFSDVRLMTRWLCTHSLETQRANDYKHLGRSPPWWFHSDEPKGGQGSVFFKTTAEVFIPLGQM